MIAYLLRRFLYVIPTLILISIVVFVIIQLPPGDYLSTVIAQMRSTGQEVDQSQIQALQRRYGLGQPLHVQYFRWVTGFIRGDFGMSFQMDRPVFNIIMERMSYTVIIGVFTVLFQWGLAIPIGIFTAVRQYSWGDYFFTFVGFIGLSMPNFLLALVLMFFSLSFFGISISGLFSPEYMGASWSWDKIIDMLSNIWVPVIVIGTAGTASLIRIMRAQMLDELGQDYVQTARSKGLKERTVIFKHTVRIAINPLISTVGWILPQIIAGQTIVGIVLSLPTLGPVLFQALHSQDMYLAGSILIMQCIFIIIGTLISDILLAVSDPRIRYD